MKKLLIVNHKKHRCGVQQFGANTHYTLSLSTKYSFDYIEVESSEDFWLQVGKFKYDGVVINYHDQTVPWVNELIVAELKKRYGPVFLITGHDHACSFASADAFIFPDPTIVEDGKNFKVGRCVRRYNLPEQPIDPALPPKIGFFGFGFTTKGLRGLVETINAQLEKATLMLHIPPNDFADPTGHSARNVAQDALIHLKDGVDFEFSHEFMTGPALQAWLSRNTINCFFYEEQKGRGISSVIDFALAAHRPIAITTSDMFRHIYHEDKILIEKNTIPQIIGYGLEPTQIFYDRWQPSNLCRDYERIFDAIYSAQGANERPE